MRRSPNPSEKAVFPREKTAFPISRPFGDHSFRPISDWMF